MSAMSIKDFYKKDLLLTLKDGSEYFLLWGDYKVYRGEIDAGKWGIELMHKDLEKFTVESTTAVYSYLFETKATIEFLN